MPLYPEAKDLIRKNLLAIQNRQKVQSVPIACLTHQQLDAINTKRIEDELPLVIAEVLFVGAHIYKSRILRDGYEIDDVLEEIESALSEQSEVIVTEYMTAIQNPNRRMDRFGNHVNDKAIFECTKYRPNPELFSVMPKGDKIKPSKQ